VIFIDTGVWVASTDTADGDHAAASQLLDSTSDDLITTDYIVDESLTLLRVRRRSVAALTLGEQFFSNALAEILHVTQADVAWQVFRQFRDKEWSFTDCVSYVTLKKLHIKTAYSFDHHFHQFGTVNVLPE
jgi:predicted nucleic acid-binding protein